LSFHLEGPWLSTTGKRRGKQKFRSAEHAQNARDIEASWTELQKRWGIEEQDRKRKNGLTRPEYVAPKLQFRGSELLNKPSLNTGAGIAVKKESPIYTGNKVKGIGTMHKSNAVPIFSDEEAQDISKMRRN
jgi:hypothetical protein